MEVVVVVDPCDLPRLLGQISNSLLRSFFARHGVFQDSPWNELPATCFEPMLRAGCSLPEAKHREIRAALHNVNHLADSRGLRVFAEDIHRFYPSRAAEFAALHGHLDKAMWVYLNLPEVFQRAATFAHTDRRCNACDWVKRTHLPRGRIKIDRHVLDRLRQSLSEYYWPNEMRGRQCAVEYFDRAEDSQCFCAYLDDWPDNRLGFTDNGAMIPGDQRCVLQNVFLFNPSEGSLELLSQDAAAYLSLQQVFCRSMLGVDIGPADPLRPAYGLGMLLNPCFTFVTEPADRIAQVFLRCIRLEPAIPPGPWECLELKFSMRTDLLAAIEIIQDEVALSKLRPAQILVRQASFHVLFVPDTRGSSEQMCFRVTFPNMCNLKSNPDALWDVGQRCLNLWGITCD